MAFWNEEIETMPVEDLKAMQLRLLQDLVKRTYRDSEFYRERMDEKGVKPEDIKTLVDIRKLPFMKKTDLRDHYPDGLFVRPYDDLVRVHVSSGTTGKPTVVGYTQKDLDNWSESLARGMTSFGMTRKGITLRLVLKIRQGGIEHHLVEPVLLHPFRVIEEYAHDTDAARLREHRCGVYPVSSTGEPVCGRCAHGIHCGNARLGKAADRLECLMASEHLSSSAVHPDEVSRNGRVGIGSLQSGDELIRREPPPGLPRNVTAYRMECDGALPDIFLVRPYERVDVRLPDRGPVRS